MAQVNPLTREVLIKLVYYGPGLGGKTSSLQCVHRASPAATRGQLVSLATPVDRTLYFDFLPLRATQIRGHQVRLQLFTVPGQVYFNATRKLVLTGADGIVFVADSQPDRHDANLESLGNLAANLEEQDRSLNDIPLVFEYNKQDLEGAMSVEELDSSLNALGRPSFATSATTGEGILESLDELIRLVIDDLEQRNTLGAPRLEPRPEPRFERTEATFGEQVQASQSLWNQQSDEQPNSLQHAIISSSVAADAATAKTAEQRPTKDTEKMIAGGVRAHSTRAPVGSPGGTTSAASADPGKPVARSDEATATQAPADRMGQTPERPRTPSFVPISVPAPPVAPAAALRSATLLRTGPSWAPFFGSDGARAHSIEVALGEGRYADALRECDALTTAILTTLAKHLRITEAETSPALLLPLIGQNARTFLCFRRRVERARAGGPVDSHDGLTAYAFVIGLRRALLDLEDVS